MAIEQVRRANRYTDRRSTATEATRQRVAARGRREPVQERSRRTVQRILSAAEEIIAADGVDAVTTRAIAERAGVAAPSLYRFFEDRDAILDALLEEMLAELETAVQEAERDFSGDSIEAFMRLEFELYVAYYERHPSLARLWFDGRVSPAVVELVRKRNHAAAQRVRRMLTEAGLVPATTPPLVFDLLIEYGDRTLDIAFRHGGRPNRQVIDAGIAALTAMAEGFSAPSNQSRSRRRQRTRNQGE